MEKLTSAFVVKASGDGKISIIRQNSIGTQEGEI